MATNNGFKSRHGLTGTPVHRAWTSMRDRCLRKTNKKFSDYGGRGITICTRWSVFENFLADMGLPPTGHTLGRINNNGNYEPSNCRWENSFQQANNKRSTQWLTINAKRIALADAARRYGIERRLLWWRVKAGWPHEQCVGLAKPTKGRLGRNQWSGNKQRGDES